MVSVPRQLCVLLLLTSLRATALPAPTRPARERTSQQMPASAFKLISISVSGSKRFAQDDLVAASGLQLGQNAGEEDFRKATERLGASGAFREVAYSYSYSPAGTKLELQVADSDKFVPAHFEDFVWFTDDELQRKVHERVPLFKDELPLTGNLPDEVSEVLQGLLVENNIAGHVDYLRAGESSGNDELGKIESIDYSVTGAEIRIRNVDFTGASPGELPLLEKAAGQMLGRQYARSRVDTFAQHELLPIFLAHGYLKAAFAPPQTKVVEQSKDQTQVDVTLPAQPGRQYKLSAVEWSGNKVFTVEQLQQLLHLPPGEPANAVRLASQLEAVQKLYGTRGYVMATVKAEPEIDDANGTVSYRLQVSEGELYHMGELDIMGLDSPATARLREAWKMRPGDVYDSSYVKRFVTEADKLLTANVDWMVQTQEIPNQQDKTVDVALHYEARATH